MATRKRMALTPLSQPTMNGLDTKPVRHMSAAQQKYLLKRLDNIPVIHPWNWVSSVAVPERIQKIRTQIKSLEAQERAWSRREQKKFNVHLRAYENARNEVRKVILFGKPANAIKALEAFEKRKFSSR